MMTNTQWLTQIKTMSFAEHMALLSECQLVLHDKELREKQLEHIKPGDVVEM